MILPLLRGIILGSAAAIPGAWLDIPKQGEDEDNDQKCPKSSDRIIAPASAVRPRGQGPDNQNDENDQND
jgi:hypothetical protein